MASFLGSVYGELILDASKWDKGLTTAKKGLSNFGVTSGNVAKSVSNSVGGVGKSFSGVFGGILSKATGVASGAMNGFKSVVSSVIGVVSKLNPLVAALGVGLSVAGLTGYLRQASGAAKEFEKAMITLEIIASRFGENAEEAQKQAQLLGRELRIGTGPAAESLQNLLKSGLNLEQASDLLRRFTNEAITGKSANISLAQAVQNLSFAYATGNSALGNMSGISENWINIIESGQKVLENWNGGINEQAGITQELADQIKAYEGQLKAQGKTLDKTNEEQAKYIGLLKLTNLTMGSSEKFAGTLIDTEAELAQKFEQIKVAVGQRVNPALNDFYKLISSKIDVESTIGTINTIFDRIYSAISNLKNAFNSGGLLVAFSPLLAFLSEVAPRIQETFNNFIEYSKPWVDTLIPILEQVGEVILKMGGAFLQSLKPAWENLVSVFNEKVIPAFEKIIPLLEPLVPLITVLAGGLGILLVGALSALLGVLSGVANAFGTLLGGVIQFVTGVVEIIGGLFNIIVGIFSGDGERIKEGWNAIWQGIQDVLGGFKDAIYGTISDFISGVIGFFKELYNVLVGNSIVPDMVNEIIGWIFRLDSIVIQILGAMVVRFIGKFREILAGASKAVADLGSVLLSWKSKLTTWGENLARAFVDGFANLGKWIKDKVEDALNKAKGLIKGDSPPKEGPYKNIDKWGLNVAQAWVDGFAQPFAGLGGLLSNTLPNNISPTGVSSGGVFNQSSDVHIHINMDTYLGTPAQKREIAKEIFDAYEQYKTGIGANA